MRMKKPRRKKTIAEECGKDAAIEVLADFLEDEEEAP